MDVVGRAWPGKVLDSLTYVFANNYTKYNMLGLSRVAVYVILGNTHTHTHTGRGPGRQANLPQLQIDLSHFHLTTVYAILLLKVFYVLPMTASLLLLTSNHVTRAQVRRKVRAAAAKTVYMWIEKVLSLERE